MESGSGTEPDLDLPTAILTWYAAHQRDLPWRRPDCGPWGVLVSEIMLQQTPVVRVEPIWRVWIERWPTPSAFAEASPADVLRAWDRLGYPRRALRLLECARAIVAEHRGVVPSDLATLRALPGIGEYTAAAVAAFAYGQRALVLDTNVRRVLGRVAGGVALPPPHLAAAERAAAQALLPVDDAPVWSVAVMELGALVCTARSPRCDDCPVATLCAWRAASYPVDEHADRRRTQAWAGTDRQVRGRIMAALRAAALPVPLADLDAAGSDPVQVERCVAGLVGDGLVEVVRDPLGVGFVRLPG